MKLDGGVAQWTGGGKPDLDGAARTAETLERLGYAGAWSAEVSHDPFLPLVPVAQRTERIDIGTSIAVAFARNPMNLAHIGWDIQAFSAGRFKLGLGSQIRPHITKRFSMEWSKPAARMRELILAIRAIWDCWDGDGTIRFTGDFYSHTLMTPNFNPGPLSYGHPGIYLAAVGELMMEVCGEVADGWISHGFTTNDYMRDVSLPALDRGLAKAGRSRSDVDVSVPIFVVTGTSEDELASSTRSVKKQIAFYGSTPAYRSVLDHHGWGDAQGELNTLSKQGRWDDMADVIDDDILHTFAIVAEPDQLAQSILDRYGDVVDRVTPSVPMHLDPETWGPTIEALSSAGGRG